MCAMGFKILAVNPQKTLFLWILSTFFQNFKTHCTHIWSNINKHLCIHMTTGDHRTLQSSIEPTEPTVCQYGTAEPTRTDPNQPVRHYW